MNIKSGRRVNYRTMIVLALIAGGFGIAVQFMPDGEILAFMVSTAAVGGLIGGSNNYNEPERQQLRQSYKTAYEWLLLAIMTAYAFIVFSSWWSILEGVAIFLNSHWPNLVISMMCLLMGLAGFQRTRSESSAQHSVHPIPGKVRRGHTCTRLRRAFGAVQVWWRDCRP